MQIRFITCPLQFFRLFLPSLYISCTNFVALGIWPTFCSVTAVHVRSSKFGYYQLARTSRAFPDIHTMKQGQWPHDDQWKAVYTVQKKCVMIAQKGNHSPENIQWGERVLTERAETSKFLKLNKSVIGCSEEWGYKKKRACIPEFLPTPPGKFPLS